MFRRPPSLQFPHRSFFIDADAPAGIHIVQMTFRLKVEQSRRHLRVAYNLDDVRETLVNRVRHFVDVRPDHTAVGASAAAFSTYFAQDAVQSAVTVQHVDVVGTQRLLVRIGENVAVLAIPPERNARVGYEEPLAVHRIVERQLEQLRILAEHAPEGVVILVVAAAVADVPPDGIAEVVVPQQQVHLWVGLRVSNNLREIVQRIPRIESFGTIGVKVIAEEDHFRVVVKNLFPERPPVDIGNDNEICFFHC